jgi:ATP-dependent RNA helicase DDX60
VFNSWLKSVQEAHGYKHKFISHPHRYSHLRKYNYLLQKAPQKSFTGLNLFQSTERLRFLHPIAMLSFGARAMPPDLALEASDTLALYGALVACQDRLRVDLDHLQPSKFFTDRSFLRQKDILRYEAALKDVIESLLSSGDPRDMSSPLHSVIHHLEDKVMQEIPKILLNSAPSRGSFRSNLIHFVSDLHVNGDLVWQWLYILRQFFDF